MLRLLSICVALLTFGTASAAPPKQEALFQRVVVPGSAFDLILVRGKTPVRVLSDLSESPDALIVHVIGDELVLTFEDADSMIKAVELLRSPVTAFHVMSTNGKYRMPVAVYVVPKSD